MAKKMDKHIYSAKLVRVVDGDTADAMIDLGFDTWVKKRIRFCYGHGFKALIFIGSI